MREIWKPVVLVVVAVALITYGLSRDPAHPTCGGVVMTPGVVCETEVKGTPQQRTYSEVVAQTRAWQIGAPIAGGAIGFAAAGWISVLLRRHRRTPDPARSDASASPPDPESVAVLPEGDRVLDEPPVPERSWAVDPTRSPWAPPDEPR